MTPAERERLVDDARWLFNQVRGIEAELRSEVETMQGDIVAKRAMLEEFRHFWNSTESTNESLHNLQAY